MTMILERLSDPTRLETMHGHNLTPVVTPHELWSEFPLTPEASQQVLMDRADVINILLGEDPRLLAVVGPCSLDGNRLADGQYAAIRMAEMIQELAEHPDIAPFIKLVMRAPVAKPRSDLGPAGLEQTDIRLSRSLLAAIVNGGVPMSMEILDRSHLARYGDLLTLGWLGARDVGRTRLRHTLSAYPDLSVLCKNTTDGDVTAAVQAAKTINHPHHNVEITMGNGTEGQLAMSPGNPHTGLIYRGGKQDMSPQGFRNGLTRIAMTGLPYIVDVDHAAAQAHDERAQKTVTGILSCFDNLLDAMATGSLPHQPKGIMIEAYLLAGADTSGNTPGMSLTDPCVDVGHLKTMLLALAHQGKELSLR